MTAIIEDFVAIRAAAGANQLERDDPLVALWAERQRLAALWIDAHDADQDARAAELGNQYQAIDERIMKTPAVSLAGILAQLDLLEIIAELYPGDEDCKLLETIRAGLVELMARHAT
jgi:hypothetical protein